MKVLIYQKNKPITQSGFLNFIDQWLIKADEVKNQNQNNVMGWISANGHEGQFKLKFKTKEMAISYAQLNGYEYRVIEEKPSSIPKKSYAENFTN
jgi:hypothetical protein